MSLPKACFAFFAGCFLLFASCRSGLAQEVQLKNDPTLPLQIVSVSPQLSQRSDGATIFQGGDITVQNTGTVPCVAFAVSVVIELSNSKTDSVALGGDLNAFGYLKPIPAQNELAPGQTYTMHNMGLNYVTGPDITVTGIKAQVDFVRTDDGTRYGNDPNKVGVRLQMKEGARSSERKRLLRIYNSGGLSALLKELQR
jgi:hypothetical protein